MFICELGSACRRVLLPLVRARVAVFPCVQSSFGLVKVQSGRLAVLSNLIHKSLCLTLRPPLYQLMSLKASLMLLSDFKTLLLSVAVSCYFKTNRYDCPPLRSPSVFIHNVPSPAPHPIILILCQLSSPPPPVCRLHWGNINYHISTPYTPEWVLIAKELST